MTRYEMLSLIFAIMGGIGFTALVGSFVMRWRKMELEHRHPKNNDISQEVLDAMKDEFTRQRQYNQVLEERIRRLEAGSTQPADAHEVAKVRTQQQA